MQTISPIYVAAVPVVDRAPAVQEVKAPAEADSSGLSGGAGNPDARDPVLASDRAREVARLIEERFNGQSEAGAEDDFPPLDTREVGDRDIIDPDRPAVRGPEPLEPAEAVAIAAMPGLQSDETQDAEAEMAIPGMGAPEAATGEEEAEAEVIELPGAPKSEDKAQTGLAPVAAVKPPSTGATAPDVPEPPPPGAVDIRR